VVGVYRLVHDPLRTARPQRSKLGIPLRCLACHRSRACLALPTKASSNRPTAALGCLVARLYAQPALTGFVGVGFGNGMFVAGMQRCRTGRTTSVRARQRAEWWAGKGVRYCPGRSDFASPIGKRASAIRDGSSPSLPRPWVCPSGLRARRALDGVGQTAVHPAAGARIPGVLSTEPDLNVREDVRLQCQRRAMNALKATAAQPDQRLPTCAKNDLPDGDKLICRSYQEGMTRSSTRKWPARAFAQRGRMTARSGFNCADPYPAVLRLSAVITPTQPPGNH
jgi:hypothetical protein